MTDGITWTEHSLPLQPLPGRAWPDVQVFDNPTPTSHAQGVAVGPDFMLYAGGNYTLEYNITSTWRLKADRGEAVETWTPAWPRDRAPCTSRASPTASTAVSPDTSTARPSVIRRTSATAR